MAECPWCHTRVADLKAPCPKCGKLASDLRLKSSPPPPDSVPDLEIPAARPSKPQPLELEGGADLQIDLSNAGPSVPPVAKPPTPGAGFSPFDEDVGAGPAIELDTVGGSLPPRVSSPSLPHVSAPPPAPVSHRSLKPTPEVAPPAAADPYEAQVLADYGPAPEAFWQTPFYAFRVMGRRNELRRLLAERREEEKRSQQRAEDAFVAFGEKVRAHVPDGPLLEPVKAAEDLLRSRDSALAGTLDAHRVALAAIEEKLIPAHAELTKAQAEETAAQAARDAAEADQKRAEAKVKRLDIEIRNGAQGKDAERGAAVAEQAQKAQKLAASDAALTEALRKKAAAEARVEVIEAERKAQEARFNRQTGTRGAGVEEAQKKLRAALADLGRAMLAADASPHLASAREEVARLEEQSLSKRKTVALHESAVNAYERPKVILGFALIAAAALLVVLSALFPFIYRALVASPPT